MPGYHPRWTAKEDLTLSLLDGVVPRSMLAAKLGRTEIAIKTRAGILRREREGRADERRAQRVKAIEEARLANLLLSEEELRDYL